MWQAVRSDARIAFACKGLFGVLLVIFQDDKGLDRLPKLLIKWIVLTGDIINNDDHELTQCVRE